MKKLFKLPLLWVLVGEVIVMAALTVVGFVFYNPDIEGSWAIVSAFVAWAGVIASTVAIFVAIQIPKKIAERQDKIALFDKRLAFYDIICRCDSFANVIVKEEVRNNKIKSFVGVFSTDKADFEEKALRLKKVILLERTCAILEQGPFLFGFDKEDTVLLTSVLISLLCAEEVDDKFDECCNNYVETSKKITKKLKPQVEEALKLM